MKNVISVLIVIFATTININYAITLSEQTTPTFLENFGQYAGEDTLTTDIIEEHTNANWMTLATTENDIINESPRINHEHISNRNSFDDNEPLQSILSHRMIEPSKHDNIDEYYGKNVDTQIIHDLTDNIMIGDEVSTTIAPSLQLTKPKQGKHLQMIKLLPHEILRSFIEDIYIRTPFALLVDTSSNSLNKTKALWIDAIKIKSTLNIILLTYSSTGVQLRKRSRYVKSFLSELADIKESTDHMEGNTYYGIIRASELVPYDSAIFVSTASAPADMVYAEDAALRLLKKRIRLYVIWLGEKSLTQNESQKKAGILGELAFHSGGEVLNINSVPIDTNEENLLTFLSSDYRDLSALEVPLEKAATNSLNTTSGLNFKIDSSGNPNVEWLSEALLQSLNLIEDSDEKYSDSTERKESLSSSEEQIKKKIRFPQDEEIETNLKNITIQKNNNITGQKYHIYEVTKIDMGIQSQLLVTSGMRAQIYFEVTNLFERPILYNFQVIGEQHFLQSLSPYTATLQGGQMITVLVTIFVPPGTQTGTKDKITLICTGPRQISQSAYIKVISNSDLQDSTAPTMNWYFGSRCEGKINTASCSDSTWNLEITAQDWETGLLRLESNPKGVMPKNLFTAGTTSLVKATYIASCCEPRVSISAYDLVGNRRTYSIDVRDIVLTDASIAAIVLGILLLILLIVILVFVIKKCRKKRQDSRDLSFYRSRAERERERQNQN